MQFSISIDTSEFEEEIELLKKSIPKAALEASRAGVHKVAEKLRQQIISSIPDEGGWYDLYKDSIVINVLDEDNVEVTTTINNISYGQIDASDSLIWISGPNAVAQFLGLQNPWPLDMIPALGDGLTADLLVRPASEREVENHRSRLMLDRGRIVSVLTQTYNEVVLEFDPELPNINGKIVADVPFLAKRLEYGLGGFPRVPVWSMADASFNRLVVSKPVTDEMDNVFAARWRSKR